MQGSHPPFSCPLFVILYISVLVSGSRLLLAGCRYHKCQACMERCTDPQERPESLAFPPTFVAAILMCTGELSQEQMRHDLIPESPKERAACCLSGLSAAAAMTSCSHTLGFSLLQRSLLACRKSA